MRSFRSYSDLRHLSTFQDRFDYLNLRGQVGESTFGYQRWLNQDFYSSHQWHRIRDAVIVRDQGCDLGIPGYEINSGLYVHHMNPIAVADIIEGEAWVLDPEFLITTSHRTHNAIHYGNESLLPPVIVARSPGDTDLW